MKNIKCIYLFSVICIFLLYACGNKTDQKKFFDVPGYFRSEIDSIKSNYTTVSKTSVYNGDTNRQELKVADVNWEKEFALFLESDINKPVYYANMELELDARLEGPRTYYISKSEKCPIQRVELYESRRSKDDGSTYFQVFEIIIVTKKGNLISSSSYSLNYWHEGGSMGFPRNAGYRIMGNQRIKGFGGEKGYSVEGRFYK